jgi:hypothetical protein
VRGACAALVSCQPGRDCGHERLTNGMPAGPMLTGCAGQEGQEGHQAKGVSVPPISPPRVPEMRPTVPTAGAIRGVRDEDKAGLSTAYGWRSNLSPGGVREDGGARRRCRGVRAVSGRIGLNRGHGVVMLRARQFARQCVLLQAAEEPAQGGTAMKTRLLIVAAVAGLSALSAAHARTAAPAPSQEQTAAPAPSQEQTAAPQAPQPGTGATSGAATGAPATGSGTTTSTGGQPAPSTAKSGTEGGPPPKS